MISTLSGPAKGENSKCAKSTFYVPYVSTLQQKMGIQVPPPKNLMILMQNEV